MSRSVNSLLLVDQRPHPRAVAPRTAQPEVKRAGVAGGHNQAGDVGGAGPVISKPAVVGIHRPLATTITIVRVVVLRELR